MGSRRGPGTTWRHSPWMIALGRPISSAKTTSTINRSACFSAMSLFTFLAHAKPAPLKRRRSLFLNPERARRGCRRRGRPSRRPIAWRRPKAEDEPASMGTHGFARLQPRERFRGISSDIFDDLKRGPVGQSAARKGRRTDQAWSTDSDSGREWPGGRCFWVPVIHRPGDRARRTTLRNRAASRFPGRSGFRNLRRHLSRASECSERARLPDNASAASKRCSRRPEWTTIPNLRGFQTRDPTRTHPGQSELRGCGVRTAKIRPRKP